VTFQRRVGLRQPYLLKAGRMKTLFVTTIVLALGFTFASAATAHRSSSYWNHYRAELRLLEDGMEWSDGTASEVLTMKCFGRGDSMRSSSRVKPWPLYRHFRCYGKTMTEYDEYGDPTNYRINVLLHVTGKFTYVITSY
jgi:hypothetical protein